MCGVWPGAQEIPGWKRMKVLLILQGEIIQKLHWQNIFNGARVISHYSSVLHVVVAHCCLPALCPVNCRVLMINSINIFITDHDKTNVLNIYFIIAPQKYLNSRAEWASGAPPHPPPNPLDPPMPFLMFGPTLQNIYIML